MVFIVMAALVLFVFKVGRTALIVSFLVFYFLQTALRAWIMRWHVPPETLFYGALTSPAFFLFTFYMITDPKTSPNGTWPQIGWAFGVVFLDLVYHLMFSLSTMFSMPCFFSASVAGPGCMRHAFGAKDGLRCDMAWLPGAMPRGWRHLAWSGRRGSPCTPSSSIPSFAPFARDFGWWRFPKRKLAFIPN